MLAVEVRHRVSVVTIAGHRLGRPPALPVSVVYSHNRHLSPRVRVFVDWVASVVSVS